MKGDNPGLKNDQGRQFKEDNCLFITHSSSWNLLSTMYLNFTLPIIIIRNQIKMIGTVL